MFLIFVLCVINVLKIDSSTKKSLDANIVVNGIIIHFKRVAVPQIIYRDINR